ncbi:uncharacterized protein EI97DRAFT_443925 [Westerdykella ornata]|uniref:Uncharacterized protein n=1 Tax=Westerdykella ornata TaxID=318751 RepID=A0A6A6JFI5_WESOR|nr:uncharacterized protein EI97DRAFT_443925 [Westerdykella ornata]KAF2274758.1 hypothetical protein EI97DRAFT_443925 [Westerdykella ornata]
MSCRCLVALGILSAFPGFTRPVARVGKINECCIQHKRAAFTNRQLVFHRRNSFTVLVSDTNMSGRQVHNRVSPLKLTRELVLSCLRAPNAPSHGKPRPESPWVLVEDMIAPSAEVDMHSLRDVMDWLDALADQEHQRIDWSPGYDQQESLFSNK